MIRSLVVAMSRNRVIGRENRLPWHLPAELAHFKRVTMGHPLLMGRRTHESIGKALPGRLNLVLTHNPQLHAPGCTVVTSLDAAWKAAKGASEVSVIGGQALFAETLALADRIYLTLVDAEVEGDTYFPDFDHADWSEQALGRHEADERHLYAFTMLRLDRRVR
jgi:dihydrofolate reductase